MVLPAPFGPVISSRSPAAIVRSVRSSRPATPMPAASRTGPCTRAGPQYGREAQGVRRGGHRVGEQAAQPFLGVAHPAGQGLLHAARRPVVGHLVAVLHRSPAVRPAGRWSPPPRAVGPRRPATARAPGRCAGAPPSSRRDSRRSRCRTARCRGCPRRPPAGSSPPARGRPGRGRRPPWCHTGCAGALPARSERRRRDGWSVRRAAAPRGRPPARPARRRRTCSPPERPPTVRSRRGGPGRVRAGRVHPGVRVVAAAQFEDRHQLAVFGHAADSSPSAIAISRRRIRASMARRSPRARSITSWTVLRAGAVRPGRGSRRRRRRWTTTSPWSGCSRPASRRSRVVFPEPFSPMIPVRSPAGSEHVTASRTSRSSKDLVTDRR